MLKPPEGYAAAALLVALFSPSLIGFATAIFKAKRGSVDSTRGSFKSGMTIHTLNALLSPCIPGYLLYVDSRTGGGSMASILSLPILPLTWILFFAGNRYVGKAARAEP